ncbi:hypothetical protein H4Q26_016823, partial [Puccinia striiformis f. sp. tritici PST-130]
SHDRQSIHLSNKRPQSLPIIVKRSINPHPYLPSPNDCIPHRQTTFLFLCQTALPFPCQTSTFTHPSKACSISSSTPPTLSAPRMNPNYQARLQQCRALPAPLLNSGQPLNQTTWHSTSQPPGLSPQSNPNTSFQGRPQQSVHVTPSVQTISPTGKRIFCPEDTLEEILDGCNVAHPAHGAPQGQDFNSSGGQHRLEQDTGREPTIQLKQQPTIQPKQRPTTQPNDGPPSNHNGGRPSNTNESEPSNSGPSMTNKRQPSTTNKRQPSSGRQSKTNKGTNSNENNGPRPNMREVNRLLKNLAKDRQPSASQSQSTGQSTEPSTSHELEPRSDHNLKRLNLDPEPGSTLDPEGEEGLGLGPEEVADAQPEDDTEAGAPKLVPIPDNRLVEIGQGAGNNDENDRPGPLVDDKEMEEICGMDLDELRVYGALHATNRRLPAYLKAELDEMYYEFERQLHILAIRNLLHATLLYTHIGQVNRMQGGTNYNNFCRFDPEAREIFSSSKSQTLKQRCKEVAQVWSTIDPDIKMKYKDPAFIDSIRGDVPMTVVNGVIQTARKAHVANTTLNLASNKKSVTFVRKWAKETIDRMNEIAGCHHIQGMLVIASGKSSGDLFITGGTRMGVDFLNMLVSAGDPLRKFHTYAAGMSVIEELMGQQPAVHMNDTSKAPASLKRKHPGIVRTGAEGGETEGEVGETDGLNNRSSMKKDKYCQGSLKDNKKLISIKLLEMLNCASEKHFRGWPGLNCARELQAAHIQVKIKKNLDNFIADELFQPIKAIKIVPSQRTLRAIGEGWICLKYQEEDNVFSPLAGSNGNPDERAPKRSKRIRASQKQSKKSERVSHDSDDESEEQLPQFNEEEEDEAEDEDEYEQDDE